MAAQKKLAIFRAMNPKTLALLLAAIPFTHCSSPSDRPGNLFRQRIPNSPMVIYKFAYESDFAFTEGYMGMTVLDSSIAFSRGKITPFPADYFSARPTANHLEMVKVNSTTSSPADTLMTPIDYQSNTINGIHVDLTDYRESYGSTPLASLSEYQFDSCSETTDSLRFYNVVRRFGARALPSTATFVKGNIRVWSTADSIRQIDIDQLIIQRGDIYKPTKPFELLHDQPIVKLATYFFYPAHRLPPSRMSDNGIFKQVY